MKHNRKGRFHSILLRYMISYATVLAVLFVCVGVYMNDAYARAIRQDTVEANINKVSAIRYQHEKELATLFSAGRQVGLSPYISSFKLLEKPMLAFHLKQQLQSYTLSLDFCDQLYLIFHEDTYLYSSATSVGLEMFLEKLMLLEDTPPEAFRAALRRQDNGYTILPCQRVDSILTDGMDSRMVAVVVPITMGERYSSGNLLFLVKESSYQQLFADAIYTPRSTYIFYGNATLSASRGLAVPDEAVRESLTGLRGTLERELAIGGRQYLLVAQPGLLYPMTYATLLPMEALRADRTRAQLGLGLFLFSLSLPCMGLTYYFSRRHVQPIKALRYLLSPASQGKDDLEAIQSGIEALVDLNEDLSARLSESLPARRANFIKDFVKGRYALREEAVRAAAGLGMAIDRECLAVALIGAPPRDGAGPDPELLSSRLDGAVAGWAVELLALEQFLFVLFADSPEAIEAWVLQAKGDAALAPSGVAVALSGAHRDFAQVGRAYLEASTAYDNRFVMGNAKVLRFADVNAAAKDITPFTRSTLDGFRKALRTGDERALSDRMDELFQYLSSSELSLFAFRMIYNSVIGALLGEGLDVDALRYYDVFTLSGCRSIADLDDLLRKLCRDILSQAGPEEGLGHPVIRGIVSHLHQHYAQPDLSMSAIADAFGISAVRLSLDFKELCGMTPSEYLLLLRMEKAKELLSETRLSVKEVGQAVGYYDASGFIRRFRQYLAMTPAQYRQRVGERVGSGAGAAEEE